MSEQLSVSQEQAITSAHSFETSQGFAQVTARQESTRGDGKVGLTGDPFSRELVDFTAADHLSIHQDGAVAGSQFNGDLFPDAKQ